MRCGVYSIAVMSITNSESVQDLLGLGLTVRIRVRDRDRVRVWVRGRDRATHQLGAAAARERQAAHAAIERGDGAVRVPRVGVRCRVRVRV